MTRQQAQQMKMRKLKRKQSKALKRKTKLRIVRINSGATLKTTEIEVIPENNSRFVTAGSTRLFDQEGRELENWKAIINVHKPEKVFNVVSKGYVIAQHDYVLEQVHEALNGFNTEEYINIMNDGGRIQICNKFTDFTAKLSNGENITLRMAIDNSYDSTTGVRVTAHSVTGDNILLYVKERSVVFYHKHTKNIDLTNISKSITKSISAFTDVIVKNFEKMINKPITLSETLNFLDNCITHKTIAVKYLDAIKDRIEHHKSDSDLDNQFDLYLLIADVLNTHVESSDSKQGHMEKMYTAIKNLK